MHRDRSSTSNGQTPGIYRPLRFSGTLELDTFPAGGPDLVHGRGRATQVRSPAGRLVLCLPLSTSLQLQSADGEWDLAPGMLQLWRDGELRVRSVDAGDWLLLSCALAPPRAKQQETRWNLLPQRAPCPRALRRLLVRLARASRDPRLGEPRLLLASCLAEAEAWQARALALPLSRCRGRTPTRRHQTLLRLMRVRMLVENHPGERLDMARLAHSANYSPWHLIRLYRDVFGETPSEYAQRLRMARAWTLVRETRRPICEITEALGFESQSSFCRAFRQAYGRTTSDVRRLRDASTAVSGLHQQPRGSRAA